MRLNIPRATTRRWTMIFTLNGEVVDIRNDAVEMRINAEPPIIHPGDVETLGESGTVAFHMAPGHTDLPERTYRYEIVWTRANGDVYVPVQAVMVILPRASHKRPTHSHKGTQLPHKGSSCSHKGAYPPYPAVRIPARFRR
jgi:hypothetical protein